MTPFASGCFFYEIIMTDKEITALALEYANATPKIADLKTPYFREYEKAYADMLRFLLRRFCLVEKKDVEAKYKEAKERYFNPDDEMEKTMYGGRMSLLEYLFPEIAKEMEG